MMALLLAIIFLSNSVSSALGSTAEFSDKKVDPVVESLAKQRGISAAEAAERIAWSEQASKMNDELIEQGAENFGGIWIDRDTDRVQIGVTGDDLTITGRVSAYGLSDNVDYVNVKYTFSDLSEKKGDVVKAIKVLSDSLSSNISVGIATDRNSVAVEIEKEASDNEKSLLKSYLRKYGDMIELNTNGSGVEFASCNWWFCDSPLRGGVEIITNPTGWYLYCTAGFGVTGNSGAKYILTAGHCQIDPNSNWSGTYWYTNDSGYNYKSIGLKHRNVLQEDGDIDAMIIRTTDIGSWSAVGKIYVRAGIGLGGFSGPSTHEEYDITDYDTSGDLIGSRVCMSGQKSADLNYYEGGSCGPVLQLETSLFNMSAGGLTFQLDGIVKANLCARHGDSGGPVFRLGKALGIVTAVPSGQNDSAACSVSNAPSSPGIMYYTGLQPIINAFDNTIHIY